jgi:hypothetical protein
MNSCLLMTLRVVTAPALTVGAVPHGTRTIYPITGGDFEGPRLRGKVLPGGADWVLLRADGMLELDLRITLETDDGALIHMTFEGLRDMSCGQLVDPPRSYFRTVPRFETAAPKYAFLNELIAVGSGEITAGGPVHTFEEIL